jgi:hypothetical protein
VSDRQPPHDLGIEAGALGAMLLYGQHRQTGLNVLTFEDFYLPFHRAVFGAMLELDHAGQAVDARIVADKTTVDITKILGLEAECPLSPPAYMDRVRRDGALRRAIRLGERVQDAGYDGDLDLLDELLGDPLADVLPEAETIVLRSARDAVRAAHDNPKRFVVPGLLARLEVLMIVAPPGAGKSMWLRQFAVLCASGMHPFRRTPMPPITVAIIDCQESFEQAGDELSRLLDLAGDAFDDSRLFIETRPQGIDISVRKHQRWLDAYVKATDADLVILGPLYNAIRGAAGRSKQSEETAELGMNALGDLMVRRDVALLVEAHAPHGEVMRIRGSKLWEDWADFGHGFVPDEKYDGRAMDLHPFRGDRHSGRGWPRRYVQGMTWPWESV